MAYSLSNKCAKNLCKRTVLVQLIVETMVTCFFGTQCSFSIANGMKIGGGVWNKKVSCRRETVQRLCHWISANHSRSFEITLLSEACKVPTSIPFTLCRFISVNRLNRCQIFGLFVFLKPNPNRISVFRTSLVPELTLNAWERRRHRCLEDWHYG